MSEIKEGTGKEEKLSYAKESLNREEYYEEEGRRPKDFKGRSRRRGGGEGENTAQKCKQKCRQNQINIRSRIKH